MTEIEWFIFISLIVIGACWLGLLACSYLGMPREVIIDAASPLDLPPNPPFVSILVPARDEEANIQRCLESLMAQDYPNFEIIVANDRSTDRTEQIVRSLAERDSRVKLINITHLPEGWTGKTHALHLASKQARGEWLVFTDADTQHSRTCLRRAMSYILRNNVDLFTTVARMENKTWWEKCLTPLLGICLMMWYPPPIVNSKRFSLGFANGQFIVIRRTAYEQIGGHEAVRGELLEDIALGKRAKRHGFQLCLALAPDLYTTRMYSDFGRFFRGWSRILLNGLDKSPTRLAVFMGFGLIMSLYPTALTLFCVVDLLWSPGYATAIIFLVSMLVYAIKVWTVSITYFVSGSARRYAILNPFSTVVVMAILAHAFYKAVRKNSMVEWRGTLYSAR